MDKIQIINFAASFVSILARILVYAIIARILASWFTMSQPGRPRHRVVQVLHDITDPIMKPLKKLPLKVGMFDFSPIVAVFGIQFIAEILIDLLFALA